MKLLDLTLTTPAENLACDEALLDWCEDGYCPDEILRFWEPTRHFVVVGYANKVATEVNVAACETRQIPVLRRCSGGGTVLQGPGCLNYALILRITPDGPFRNVGGANRFIMERNRQAVESVPATRQSAADCISKICRRSAETPLRLELDVRGHTDLAKNGLKFSGNSQRRRKNYLLFHGTFLLNFDLELVSELLRMPSQQPDYRNHRSHGEFLTNLNMPAADVKTAIQRAWEAESPLKNPPSEQIAVLAQEKYATREWNLKF